MHLVLVLSSVAVVLLYGGSFGLADEAGSLTALTLRTFVKKDCDGVKTYICDTCTSRKPCINTTEIDEVFPCNAGFFCVEGTDSDRCGPTPTPECQTSAESQSFNCPYAAVLPDPVNCKDYHVCLAAGEMSGVYTCAPGYVFSAASLSCIRQVSAANCVTVNCPFGNASYVLYGTSGRYYVQCTGSSRATQVLRCPNGALFRFFSGSTRFGECVYTCTGQGNYANSNNPSQYFQCYFSSGRLLYTELSCPNATVFNQTLGYCTRP